MEMRHQKVGSKNRWRLKPKDIRCQSERYYVQDYKERFGQFFLHFSLHDLLISTSKDEFDF